MIHNEIRCDNCGKVAPVDGKAYGRWRAHVARDQAKFGHGWRVGEDGGKDFCSDCVNDMTSKN